MTAGEQKFNDIQSKVHEWNPRNGNSNNNYSDTTSSSSLSSPPSSYLNQGFVLLKNNWVYLLIPVAVTGALMITKPWFLLKKPKPGVHPTATKKKQLDMVKLLISIVVISAALGIGLFAYKYKTKI